MRLVAFLLLALALPACAAITINLSANPAASVAVGGRVAFTASITGAARPYYRFEITDAADTTVYTRDYGTGRSTIWSPPAAGPYTVTARVKDGPAGVPASAAIGFTVLPALSAVSITCAPGLVTAVGTRVTFTATATGGGTLEYRPVIGFQTGPTSTPSWDTTRPWGLGRACTVIPNRPGFYRLRTYAREKGTTANVASQDILVEVKPAVTDFAVTFTPSSGGTAGSTVTITATNPTGGGTLEWKAWAKLKTEKTWTLVRDYAPDPAIPWTPATAGEYDLMVYAREVGRTSATYDVRRAGLAYVVSPAIPAIAGFAPLNGPDGSQVKISGAHLSGATDVRFAGAPAVFSCDGDAILAIVPDGAESGKVTVTTPGGTVSSLTDFAVRDPILGDTCTNPRDGSVLVYIPAGAFLMGTPVDAPYDFDEAESPQRLVYLDAYWMMRDEVTVAQYRAFCIGTGRAMPVAPLWGWHDDHPVVNVTWFDAKAYADWAGMALPTEAQWEKTARGTDGRLYVWGSAWPPPANVGNFADAALAEVVDSETIEDYIDGHAYTAPVGSFSAGASPYGCRDMAGNVWEWCADWFDEDYYSTAPGTNPPGPQSGTARVARGGSFLNADDWAFRTTCRPWECYPSIAAPFVGFRCARRLKAAPTITAMTPAYGPIGARITLTGTGLAETTTVTFGGVPAPSFTVVSARTVVASVPTGAVSGPISVTTTWGTTTSQDDFAVAPSPAITAFSPAYGHAGSLVTVYGTHLTDATAITFNGTPAAAFSVADDGSIVATVPARATTGPIGVTTPSGTSTSATSFAVTPVISGFSPESGPVGHMVTITGLNLIGATHVAFNGTPAASFTVSSPTSITAKVPEGATTGPILVTTPAGSTASSGAFTLVPVPTITSLSRYFGPVGTQVTVIGTNLGGLTSISVGGTPTSPTVVGTTSVVFDVPAGAATGPVTITTPYGTASTVRAFSVTSAVVHPGEWIGPLAFGEHVVRFHVSADGRTITVTGSPLPYQASCKAFFMVERDTYPAGALIGESAYFYTSAPILADGTFVLTKAVSGASGDATYRVSGQFVAPDACEGVSTRTPSLSAIHPTRTEWTAAPR